MGRQDTKRRYRFKEVLARELQQERGLQARVSEKANVNQSSISYWISPRTTALPSVEQAYDIAKALGLSLEYLITGKEDATISPGPTLSSQEDRLIAQFRKLSSSQQSAILGLMASFAENESTGKQAAAG